MAGDGTIAFTANTGVDATYSGHQYIFLMNAGGTNARNITPGLPGSGSNCCNDLSLAISPDGNMVAVLASINKAPDRRFIIPEDDSFARELSPVWI